MTLKMRKQDTLRDVFLSKSLRRGEEDTSFGPLRPVGYRRQRRKRDYAVVQLRQDNEEGTSQHGRFQTNLKWGEESVFRMIPALRNAEFVRRA